MSVGRSKKTGAPSISKVVLEHWEATLPDGPSKDFTVALRSKRKRDTALTYMQSYQRFWLPYHFSRNWFRLHPSLNPTGTDTLRWSCANPNEQNISKQEGLNIRYTFGPVPGREWWKFDGKNLELRIPAYESGEKKMIDLFDRAKDPPYYGSYHLLIFDILHPEKFAEHGTECKNVYESTWYQWTKNGDFAVVYGAVEESGTADRAYHVPGAQRKIKEHLKDLAKLNQKYIDLANKYGWVETLPDKTVDPDRGYPLLCTRSEYGRVLPTVPFNYHVQGTACWWMMKAMIRVYAFLESLNQGELFAGKRWPGGYYITMQIHDELDLDCPAGKGREPWKYNLPVIRRVQKLMEQGGADIGVPTPVSCEYHARTWAEGKAI